MVLHRDPAGNEHLGLGSPLFEERWQNDVAAATANTAHGVLAGSADVPRTVALARSVMAATSRLADGLLARAPEGAVACRAGCDHCCYQAVGVTPPEVLAIFDHVQRTRGREALAELAARVSDLAERTRGLSSAERFSPEFPCPFLESARCSIYEVRPLSCRGTNSLDAGECERRLRDPEARAEFLSLGSGGRSFKEPIRAVHAISAGLQLALSELYHLDMRPLELTAALRLLFERAETLSGDWVSGSSPFESALSTDSSSDPVMRELSGAITAAESND